MSTTLPAHEKTLDALLGTTLEWLSPHGRHILRQLVRRHGYVKGADRFARDIGYRDRHHLDRTLGSDGLLRLEALAGWMRVLRWTICAMHQPGLSLATLARQDGREPAACSRHLRDLTGFTWTEVQLFGPHWVVQQLRTECVERRRRATKSARRA